MLRPLSWGSCQPEIPGKIMRQRHAKSGRGARAVRCVVSPAGDKSRSGRLSSISILTTQTTGRPPSSARSAEEGKGTQRRPCPSDWFATIPLVP